MTSPKLRAIYRTNTYIIMSRKIFWTLIVLLMLPLMVTAQRAWNAETLPMVHLQDARRYVCNPEGILSQTAVDSTDALLAKLEKEKGIESVVVCVSHLEGGDPYQFGMNLARKYGIGDKKQRTGLIVILATGDRKYQILTGNGLEGSLPDAICRRIENRVMVPRLKQGDWDNAIFLTMKSIDAYVRNDPSLMPKDAAEGSSDEMPGSVKGLILATFVMAIMLLFFYIKAERSSVCPHCHKRKLRIVKARKVTVNGRRFIRYTYRCAACGYTEDRYRIDNDGDGFGAGGALGFPIFFGGIGGRGGSGGGGGFSCGSFGGGSFGGGGSGGSF